MENSSAKVLPNRKLVAVEKLRHISDRILRISLSKPHMVVWKSEGRERTYFEGNGEVIDKSFKLHVLMPPL